MSELIEIHQLDYKACSLTYGEGACTASSTTRPEGETVAAFNGTSSKISTTAVAQANSSLYEYEAFIKLDSYTGPRKVFGEYSSNNNGFAVKINNGSINVYLQNNPSAYGRDFFFTGYDFLSGETLKITLEKKSGATNQTVCKVYINGNFISPGSSTNSDILLGLGNYTLLEIGQSTFGSSLASLDFEGAIKNFTVKKDGVLVRDLPLLTNADDLTGNSTPVATDVFTLTCPSITRGVAEFNGSSSKIEYGLQNNFGAYIPFQTNTYIFECVFFDLPTVGQHQIYDSSGTHFYFSGGSGALSLIVEGYSCGSFVVTSEIQQQAGFKLVMTTNGTTADYEAFINGSSIGTLTRNPSFPPSTATAAKLGEYRNVGINADFKMADWKTYKNGVLETDIPLIDSATDQTGNSTPTATDVSFVSQSLSGVDPNDPTQCALIENPDGKCFNTYATCQDIANYAQTSKTLTFAKKQAAALPLESLQRVEGTGAEFNNSSSRILMNPVLSNNFANCSVECVFALLADSSANNSDQIYIYTENTDPINKNIRLTINQGGDVSVGIRESSFSFSAVTSSYLGGFVIGQSYKLKYEFTTLGSTAFTVELFVDDVSLGSHTVMDFPWVAAFGEIGSTGNGSSYSRNFSLSNFKINLNGVLVRDLPLLTDATDLTGNSTPVATDVTFTGQTIDYKAALPHIPLLDSSSTKSGELNIGARRSVSGPLGKYSSASVTMTDEAYSDNLTDPYIAERTYNPLERGTFWSKFLAQNPYHEGDTYRIYNGEAGQDLASMPFKQFIVDRITAPNSGGNVSIKLVDQFRKLDPAKAIFLNLGVNKLTLDLTATASDVITDYTFADLERDGITSAETSPQNNYIKIGAEIIKVGGVAGGSGLTFDFSSCDRGLFGTTAVEHAAGELIQACYYFTPSVTNPSDQRGLYFYLQTLFNAAGISDSFLDLANWEGEITSRLYLFNDVERLITEPTNINQLIGELQRDCGFFTWFDETDKKIKLKAVVPEFPFIEIIEDRDLIAGKTSHRVETTDRVTEVQTKYGVINYLGGTTGVSNYRNAFVNYGDGANPNKYGQSQVYSRESHWLQTAQQVRDSNNRILARYDDNIKFVNFSLDHAFSVRMGQVFKMKYSGFTEANGQAKTIFWQVIGLDRVDNEIKVIAQEFYLGSEFKVWGDSTTTQTYDSATSEEQETFFYWGVSKWG